MATKATTLWDLATVKQWLKVPTASTGQDPQITQLADAVSERIERWTARYFVTRTLTETKDGDGTNYLILRYRPVISVTAFTIGVAGGTQQTPVAGVDYILYPDPGWIKLRTLTLPRDFGNVIVTYTAGYGLQTMLTTPNPSLPQDIVQAGLDWIKAVYDEYSANATAANTVTVGPMTFVLKPNSPPPGVKAVLDSWKEVRA